ncbi:MAG: hypothetical protein ACYC64_08430 [Armatimonadota bacterium]
MDATFFERANSIECWCGDKRLIDIAVKARKGVFNALADQGVMRTYLLGDPPNMTMENAFCRLELLRMLGVDTKFEEWRSAADSFRDLIAIVLSQCALPTEELGGGYYGLVSKLCQNNFIRNSAVLTLNYELGLENAVEVNCQQSSTAFFDPTTLQRQPCLGDLYDYHLPNRGHGAFTLLKLHGSCNWGYCSECDNVQWFPRESDGRFDVRKVLSVGRHREKCPWHCVDPSLAPRYSAHIVPPTWNKWMGDFTLRHIWRKAYEVIKKAEALFIVGTSLPPTDSHLRHLLAATVAPNVCSIYIVNKVDDAQDRQCYLHRLYKTTGLRVPADSDKQKWAGFDETNTIDWIIERVQRHVTR